MTSLGVQLYSVREAMASDRDATLRRIAGLGYQAVEPYDPLTDPTGFRALADELGLNLWSTHAPVLGELRDAVLDAAGMLGLDTVIVPAIEPARFADRAGVEASAAALNDTAARAADRGIRLGYHNHYWELESVIDGRPALEILDEALNPEILLEVDVYWAHVGGADAAALLRRLGDRVRFLHVKDGPGTHRDPMTAVGAGTLPIPDILAAAPDARRIVELDACATDIFDALADSHRYLTGLAS